MPVFLHSWYLPFKEVHSVNIASAFGGVAGDVQMSDNGRARAAWIETNTLFANL